MTDLPDAHQAPAMPAGTPCPRKVLIIKPSSLGDVVSAMPVLHGLRRSFPQASVSWLVTAGCAGVLEGQDGLDEIILFDRKRYGRMARSPSASREFWRFCRQLRQRRFDWVLDLQGLFRSGFLARISGASVRAGFRAAREMAWLFYTHRVRTSRPHTVDRNIELARAIGIDARPEDLVLSVTPAARQAAAELLMRHGLSARQFALVAPGTRWANKLYPVRHWRKVVELLTERLAVVLVGAPDEIELCNQIAAQAGGNGQRGGEPVGGQQGARADPAVLNLAGQTKLPELVALMSLAGVVVCSESSANFIAPAVGTPFVTLMGPTRAERTGPYAGRGRIIFADVPCLGCLRRACSHASCMQLIDPAEVAAAALALEQAR